MLTGRCGIGPREHAFAPRRRTRRPCARNRGAGDYRNERQRRALGGRGARNSERVRVGSPRQKSNLNANCMIRGSPGREDTSEVRAVQRRRRVVEARVVQHVEDLPAELEGRAPPNRKFVLTPRSFCSRDGPTNAFGFSVL